MILEVGVIFSKDFNEVVRMCEVVIIFSTDLQEVGRGSRLG